MSAVDDDAAPQVAAFASACAAQLPPSPSSFHQDVNGFGHAYDQLLKAVAQADPRYAFDHDGRPAALQTVRSALPAVEAELLDAIIEDVACQLAAVQEALYRVAIAARR